MMRLHVELELEKKVSAPRTTKFEKALRFVLVNAAADMDAENIAPVIGERGPKTRVWGLDLAGEDFVGPRGSSSAESP